MKVANIVDLLEFEEGYREKPYIDSEGFPTVGIGQKIGPKGSNLRHYEMRVPKTVARAWLDSNVASISDSLAEMDWFMTLNYERKVIITSMAYQLGITGLLGFKKMIAAIKNGDFDLAAKEALDSRWYKYQTPERALRHAKVLRTGELSSAYY